MFGLGWGEAMTTGYPDDRRLELSVGDATWAFSAAEVADVLGHYVER